MTNKEFLLQMLQAETKDVINEHLPVDTVKEMFEMDFLRENGINPNYNDVEKHIEKITNIFEDQFKQNLEMNTDDLETVLQDLEDKTNAIGSASDNLSDLKRLAQSMRKSDMRTNIMVCIERMELDLC